MDKTKMTVVYHSVPHSVLMNPIYRKEFILKFDTDVMHVLDSIESCKESYPRQRAQALSNMIKQICPLILPVSERELQDHNLGKRDEIAKVFAEQAQKIQYVHS